MQERIKRISTRHFARLSVALLVLMGSLGLSTFTTPAPASAAACTSNCLTPGDYTLTTTHDGENWTYLVHVPASYTGATPVPLLLDMHGDNGTATEYRSHALQLPESDKRGFIAVWPQAWIPPGNTGGYWNGNGCCMPSDHPKPNIDSVGFLRKVIDTMKVRANINENRIFVTGGSAGGAMAHRFGCDAADAARAVIPISMSLNKPEICHPSRPITEAQIHGKQDWLVPYNGSTFLGFASAPSSLKSWSTLDGCTGKPVRTMTGTSTSYTDTYTTCSGGVRVSLTTVQTGSHTADVNNENFNPAAYMWDKLLNTLV